MKTQVYSQNETELFAKLLKAGEVVCFPTETVFGLGVVYNDLDAYQKLIAIKRRPADKPFTLMCADVDEIAKYAFINDKTQRMIDHFMPGPLTIIVQVKPNVPKWVTHDTGWIGIRISSLEVVRSIIRKTGVPLLVPSANRAGEEPAYNDKEALKAFGGELSAIMEGEANLGVPSTVIKIHDKITLIREGTIPLSEIIKVWEQ